MPNRFSYSPVDSGYGDLGRALAGGVQSGVDNFQRGRDRKRQEELDREAEERRAEQDRVQRADREYRGFRDEVPFGDIQGAMVGRGTVPAVRTPGGPVQERVPHVALPSGGGYVPSLDQPRIQAQEDRQAGFENTVAAALLRQQDTGPTATDMTRTDRSAAFDVIAQHPGMTTRDVHQTMDTVRRVAAERGLDPGNLMMAVRSLVETSDPAFLDPAAFGRLIAGRDDMDERLGDPENPRNQPKPKSPEVATREAQIALMDLASRDKGLEAMRSALARGNGETARRYFNQWLAGSGRAELEKIALQYPESGLTAEDLVTRLTAPGGPAAAPSITPLVDSILGKK